MKCSLASVILEKPFQARTRNYDGSYRVDNKSTKNIFCGRSFLLRVVGWLKQSEKSNILIRSLIVKIIDHLIWMDQFKESQLIFRNENELRGGRLNCALRNFRNRRNQLRFPLSNKKKNDGIAWVQDYAHKMSILIPLAINKMATFNPKNDPYQRRLSIVSVMAIHASSMMLRSTLPLKTKLDARHKKKNTHTHTHTALSVWLPFFLIYLTSQTTWRWIVN